MPHRQKLLNLLNNYFPKDQLECDYKDRMIEFAKNHPKCFERAQLEGHFTASAWLLDKKGERALLMHHRKLDRWFQLGGHADGESDLLQVAVKEAREESGIEQIVAVSSDIFDIDVHEIPESKGVPSHFHYDVRFLLQVNSDEEVRINSESKELRWITRNANELPTSAVSVTRMFDKWNQMA